MNREKSINIWIFISYKSYFSCQIAGAIVRSILGCLDQIIIKYEINFFEENKYNLITRGNKIINNMIKSIKNLEL